MRRSLEERRRRRVERLLWKRHDDCAVFVRLAVVLFPVLVALGLWAVWGLSWLYE